MAKTKKKPRKRSPYMASASMDEALRKYDAARTRPVEDGIRADLVERRKRRKKLNVGNEYIGWAHLIPLAPLFP